MSKFLKFISHSFICNILKKIKKVISILLRLNEWTQCILYADVFTFLTGFEKYAAYTDVQAIKQARKQELRRISFAKTLIKTKI